MRNIKLFLLLLLPFFIFSQEKEKRLALVIGNSNYEKGKLKNPVNDAKLIASTLDSLDFDVILKENLATRRDMLSAIEEFGEKRSHYKIAFVYYAGHGVQVNDENFLLPTKEIYESINDVLDYAVSVQKIMRYLETQADQVNILILDACRDNPFESNWRSTRSLKGGGLAKLPAPTGSLIAFSTDSGQTAPDGNGKNSIYSMTLSEELKTANVSIEQVFKNVRTKVLELSNETQRPVEESKLTGGDFYMAPLDYVKIINSAEKLFSLGENYNALEIITALINNKNYKKSYAYKLRSAIYAKLNNYEKALDDVNKFIELNVRNDNGYSANGEQVTQKQLINSAYITKGQLYHKFKFFENAVKSFTRVFENSDDKKLRLKALFLRGYAYQEFADTFYNTPQYLKESEYLELAIKDYKYVIDQGAKYASVYQNLSNAYSILGKDNLSLETIEKALEIEPNNEAYLISKANKLKFVNEMDKALEIYNQVVNLNPANLLNYYNRAYFYAGIGDHDKALIDYKKVEDTTDMSLLKKLYFYRAKSYHAIKDYLSEILDLNRVIDLDPKYFNAYKNRGMAYLELEKFSSAIKDLEKTMKLAPSLYSSLYGVLATTYEDIQNYEKAKENYEKAIQANPLEFFNYQFFSNLYLEIGEYQNALNVLNLFNKNNPQSPKGLLKLGRLFNEAKDFEKAMLSYKQALLIDPNNLEASTQLGYTLFSQYKFDESLPYFEKVVELDPNNMEARLYLALVYMQNRKENETDVLMEELADSFGVNEIMLYSGFLTTILGAEDNDKKILQKALSLYNQYDLKNGYSMCSSLLQFITNLFLQENDQALLNISQAISLFGKDSYTDDGLKVINEIKIYDKKINSITIIDLYLFRAWLYYRINDEGSCKDLKRAIKLIESRNIDKNIEYFCFDENRNYQNLLEVVKGCNKE